MTDPTTETGARSYGADTRAQRRESDLAVGSPLNDKPRRRQVDGWLDRWVAATADLTRLKDEHPMVDAVIDEQIGRQIRIGDHWLTDWASCNYLGFDLDEEIIAAVPEYLAKWGTHPSWSRLLGSPRLYQEIEEQMTDLLACEDVLLLPTITHIHMSMIPVLVGDGTVFLDGRAHKTIYDGAMVAAGHGADVVRFRHNDAAHLEELLAASDPGQPRVDRDGRRQLDDRQRAGHRGVRPPRERARRPAVRGRCPRVRRDRRTFTGRALRLRHLGEQPAAPPGRGVRQRHPGRRILEVLFVAPGVHRPSDEVEGCLQGAGASVPLLRAVARRIARDHDRRARSEPHPRRRRSLRDLADGPTACSTRWSGSAS